MTNASPRREPQSPDPYTEPPNSTVDDCVAVNSELPMCSLGATRSGSADPGCRPTSSGPRRRLHPLRRWPRRLVPSIRCEPRSGPLDRQRRDRVREECRSCRDLPDRAASQTSPKSTSQPPEEPVCSPKLPGEPSVFFESSPVIDAGGLVESEPVVAAGGCTVVAGGASGVSLPQPARQESVATAPMTQVRLMHHHLPMPTPPQTWRTCSRGSRPRVASPLPGRGHTIRGRESRRRARCGAAGGSSV